ncbi:MAG: hypothetical protein V4673_14335 [Pseudomonadota bacterium]
MGTLIAYLMFLAVLAGCVWLAGKLVEAIECIPSTVLIVRTLLVAALVIAFVTFPPKRNCKPGSLEHVFTNCEVQP